jgi:hypothetical protein
LRPKSLVLLPLLLALICIMQPPLLAQAGMTWSSPIQVDSNSGLNSLSTALQASNGTLWLAWQSDLNALTTGRMDIIYKTYTNGVWSSDQDLTSSGWNAAPSLVQLANGTIAIFWSMKPAHSYEIFYSQYSSLGWSSPTQITTTSLNDTEPSAAVGRDGSVWLVWTRVNSTITSSPPLEQLYYMTWKNGVWSGATQLTTDSNQNWGSSVTIAKDGIVRVTWSKGLATTTYQLYDKTYNGTVWSPDSQLVSSSTTDEHPSMIQDRNGTLWLFWGRLIVSGSNQYYVLMAEHSYNLGVTWSSAVQLTPTPTGSTLYDSFQPSAVQSDFGVKGLWVFYASNYNVPTYNMFALMSSGISPVHDVIISGLTASNNQGTPWEYPGGFRATGESAIETIAVPITNIGDYVETVNVTLSVTNTTVITLPSAKSLVSSGSTTIFYFYWNTTNVKPARYGLSVKITLPSGEWTVGNMPDSSYILKNMIHIIPLGDVNQAGSVTITDISVFLSDFNYSASCNCSHWNPYANIDGSGTIDIVDVAIAMANFNTYT